MSSTAQISANRLNSLHSTGPKTDAGKSASSRNAISHGLSAADPVLSHEDRSAFLALVDRYRNDFSPGTAHEEFLVAEMAGARWKLDRATRIENALLSGIIDSSDAAVLPEIQMANSIKDSDPIARLDRHRAALERTYLRCARELRAAKKFQNEANSDQLAQKKFLEMVKEYIQSLPPGTEIRPKLVRVEPAPKASDPPQQNEPSSSRSDERKPGPRIPNTTEEWRRNCEYAFTNPALRL